MESLIRITFSAQINHEKVQSLNKEFYLTDKVGYSVL